MDLLRDAAYAVVHEFPGGAPALANLCNLRAGTLANKVNPGQEHELTVKEAIAIQHAASDCRILQAEAALLNHAVIPLKAYEGVSDLELLDLYAQFHADVGKTAENIRSALADKRVSRRELVAIERAFHESVRAGLAFIDRLQGIVDDH